MQAAKEFEADGDTYKAGRSSIIPKVFYEKKKKKYAPDTWINSGCPYDSRLMEKQELMLIYKRTKIYLQ